MRTAMILSTAVLLAACSKKDDCQQFVDKSRSVFTTMAKTSGKEITSAQLDELVKTCREHHGKPGNKDDEMMKCVLAASGDEAVAACWGGAMGAYKGKSKSSEVQLQLKKLSKNLKVYYVTEAKFPIGKAGPTPAEDCCKGPNAKCAVTDAWTKDPVWQAIDFQIDEPNLFRYTYESDGKTATATAIGDLDCDGTAITYKLNMTVDKNGTPSADIVEPPADSD